MFRKLYAAKITSIVMLLVKRHDRYKTLVCGRKMCGLAYTKLSTQEENLTLGVY
jgi:hypothetical protein